MIYLDNAATTKPMDSEFNLWFNASSLYSNGLIAHQYYEKALEDIGNIFNVDTDSIMFTSGATESANWVIHNLIKQYKNDKIQPCIISSPIEHPCVKNTIQHYVDEKIVKVRYLSISNNGFVDVDSLNTIIEEEGKENIAFVTCMYVNNEIGNIQPISKIGEICDENDIHFVVDATQAVGKIDIDMKKDCIDFMFFSGHKFNGPKGIGCLISRHSFLLSSLGPFMFGGHQQRSLRPGTEDIISIKNMVTALETHMKYLYEAQNKNARINTYLQMCLTKDNDVIINSMSDEIPILNCSFKNISGEYIVQELSARGIYCSTGSACTSGDLEVSHVLKALNVPDDYIRGTIRLSFDYREIDFTELDYILKSINDIIKN